MKGNNVNYKKLVENTLTILLTESKPKFEQHLTFEHLISTLAVLLLLLTLNKLKRTMTTTLSVSLSLEEG